MKVVKSGLASATKYGAAASGAVSRGQNGSSILELPVMLWFVFVVFLMPMLALATTTLKAALINAAVQDGVQFAAKARTFQDGTAEKPSAVTLAEGAVKETAKRFPGLNVDSVGTQIVITPLTGGAVVRSASKLTTPADTSKFVYQLETVVKGRIDPLFSVSPQLLGTIPGLNAPMLISYSGRQMAEFPQGLDK